MNRSLLIGIVTVVVLLGIGVLILNPFKNQTTAPQSEATLEATPALTQSPVATDQTSTDSATTQEAMMVEIKNFSFSPATLTVRKGTTVTWTNQDSVKHNVFSATDGGPQGPLLGKDESYSFTFEKVGTFSYICQPHPNMKGTVTVTEWTTILTPSGLSFYPGRWFYLLGFWRPIFTNTLI